MNSQSKVIFWNIWGHRYSREIHDYLMQHANADVMCLTEVTDATQQEIDKNGRNFVYSGDEAASQVDGFAQLREQFGDTGEVFYVTADYRKWKCIKTDARFSKVGFGSALIVKNDLSIVEHGHELLAFDEEDLKSRVLQWIVYIKKNTRYLVAHIHGVWIKGNTKGDHAARDKQSLFIREILARIAHLYGVDKIIFGGDLNLDIETEALKILEGDNWRNLIKEYGIANTRTAAYRHLGLDGYSMYADYVLVSQTVDVHSFTVDNNLLASDHAPLIVEFT